MNQIADQGCEGKVAERKSWRENWCSLEDCSNKNGLPSVFLSSRYFKLKSFFIAIMGIKLCSPALCKCERSARPDGRVFQQDQEGSLGPNGDSAMEESEPAPPGHKRLTLSSSTRSLRHFPPRTMLAQITEYPVCPAMGRTWEPSVHFISLCSLQRD